MSKLTNCQIRATISGMEITVRRKAEQGDKAGTRITLAKMLAYRAELAGRLAVEEDPGSEIQESRNGER